MTPLGSAMPVRHDARQHLRKPLRALRGAQAESPHPTHDEPRSYRTGPAVAALSSPAAVLAMQRQVGNAATAHALAALRLRSAAAERRALISSHRPAPGSAEGLLGLQRTLELVIDKADVLKGMNAEQAYQAILAGLTVWQRTTGKPEPVLINWRAERKRRLILQVLDEWITAPPADMKNRDTGRYALSRSYASYQDIASAVLDRVRSLYGVVIEENLAKEISTDQAVQKWLVTFIHDNLLPWVNSVRLKYGETLKSLDMTTKQLASINRLYLPYLERSDRSLAHILSNPTRESIATLISAIHDLAEILYHPASGEEAAKAVVEVPEDKLQGLVLEGGELVAPEFTRRPLGEYRGKLATPQQGNAQVATAGKLGYPVSLGPSRTTGKLMMLAAAAGATTEMKEALAWAIFSLWYLQYRRDLTDIHRYHFVMDMAAVFGVPYDPVGVPRRPGGGDFTALIKASMKEAHTKVLAMMGPGVASTSATTQTTSRAQPTMPQVVGPAAEPEFTEHQLAILRKLSTTADGLVELPEKYADDHTQAKFGLSRVDFDAAWIPLWDRGKNKKDALVRPQKGVGLALTSKGRKLLPTL